MRLTRILNTFVRHSNSLGNFLMALRPEHDAALEEIRQEWDQAERCIKLAEQVNGEIINPAIYELRYAGRRIMEAIALADEATVASRLQDAKFDCMRARHDAIDAATSKIAADIDLALKHLGASVILEHAPDIVALGRELGAIRDSISISREKREDRNAIYAVIMQDNMQDIVRRYNEFKYSEPLLKKYAGKQRRSNGWLMVFGIAGILTFIVAASTLGYMVWHDDQASPLAKSDSPSRAASAPPQ